MVDIDDMMLRSEDVGDKSATRSVNELAFGRLDEADLVDNLRQEGAVLLSLVAEVREEVVGHILFSRMWIDQTSGSITAVALAPIAVLPAYQRRGIGGELIRTGMDLLRDRGEHIVLVLGDSEYYSRYGFSTVHGRSLESPFPPDAFMAAELSLGALSGICGKVRYALSFGL